MTWFRVDDGMAFHPKAIAAGNSALGLWLRAGAWCSKALTDGALPRHMVGTLGAQRRDALRLVTAGLWCETDEGYQFNDWEDWQYTKAQVTAKREADQARQKAHREGKRHAVTAPVTPPVTNSVSHSALTKPNRSSNEEQKSTPLRVVPPVSEMNAGQVLGMWLETLNRRPAGSVVGQLGKHVKALLEDKFSQQEILDGLNSMQAKGLNPSVLPSLVSSSAVRSKSKPMRNPEEMHSPATRFSG